MKTTSLLLTLVLAAPATGRAQVAGHSSLPTTGPAARERTERPEEDPLLVQVDRLRRAGLRFRNDIVRGPGGAQVLIEDPSGNPVELFQPAR